MADFDISIQVDSGRAIAAIRQFAKGLDARRALLVNLGAAMLVSVRRTFREQGSPAHSWMPLAPSTVRKDPKRYGAGHQMLIGSGRLLNSIAIHTRGTDQVVLGTNLRYAAVHQFGSKDRGSIGLGPRTEEQQNTTVKVKEHAYFQLSPSLGSGRLKTVDKLGRSRKVRAIIAGPRNQRRVNVAGHARHQNIPARPYLVFRPEDPERLADVAKAYVNSVRRNAGLGE